MKVLTITTDYLPNIGGIANHISNLNLQLFELGIDANILHICEYSQKSGLELYREPFRLYRYRIRDSLKGIKKLKYRQKINEIIKEKFSDVDIIHTHELFNTEYLLSSAADGQWVWTNHTSQFNDLVSKKTSRNIILKVLTRHTLSRASAIICVSEKVKKQTRLFLPKRSNIIRTIRNGVDFDRFQRIDILRKEKFQKEYRIPDDKLVVMIVARWVSAKGIHVAVEAMEYLKKHYADFFNGLHFVFAGCGVGDSDYINKMKIKLSEFNNYQTIDTVPNDRIQFLYSCGKIVLIPSIIEQGGIVFLEAMGCGKVVLAANVGGLAEVVRDGENGYLFEGGNSEALAEKLKNIIQTEDLSIGEASRKYVTSKYDWRYVAEETLEVYEDVIKRKKARVN